ncbi:response regulator transcription factor [Paenibacillus koleovorans]|uniref:response regulator transcription factor n=1 Tax=Paenibacillus koleovorans TaxID=121608 RepID=UPI0013E383C5|nr:response regulator transcription factor [Paenibacillus koleovorans]
MAKTKVLIADDQPLIRDGLAAILSMEEAFEVVARSGDGLATIEAVALHRPHLVMMDIHMPKLNGLEATKRIKAEWPDTKVLILTTFEDEDYVWDAMLHGASGFLVKGVETGAMLTAIQDCLGGRINYPASLQRRLLQAMQMSGGSAASPLPGTAAEPEAAATAAGEWQGDKLNGLSAQERNIVRQLMLGKSNQAIAAELFLSIGTVKNYLSTIYRKLDVASRSEALAHLNQSGKNHKLL